MSKPTDKQGAVQADVPREFYTIREFAGLACLNVDSVYRMRARGQVASVRIGGEWRIPREEVDRLKAAAFAQVGERRPA